jgi:hypothetical protein
MASSTFVPNASTLHWQRRSLNRRQKTRCQKHRHHAGHLEALKPNAESVMRQLAAWIAHQTRFTRMRPPDIVHPVTFSQSHE